MDITNAKRAECSGTRLQHIREYTGKIVVIKYGGNAMINEDLKDSVMMDIVLLSRSASGWCWCTAADPKSPIC